MPFPSAAPEAAVEPAAGGRHRPAAFLGDDDDGLDDSDEETAEEAFDEDDEDDQPKPRVASSTPMPIHIPNLNGVPVAVQAAAAVEDGYATPQRKRQRVGAAAAASVGATKPLVALEDPRRLFQRLWTDEDEIVILQGFLDFNSRRGHHHQDTGPFYDQIRARLQLDFNKSQLVEKLRRLKKKYRNVTSKMSSRKDYAFKTPHDQATFELSRQIWGAGAYSRSAGDDDDDVDQIGGVVTIPDRLQLRRRGRKRPVAELAATAAAEALVLAAESPVEVKAAESHVPTTMAPVPNVVEETVRSCLSPMFMDLLCCAVGGRTGAAGLDGLRLSLLPLSPGSNQVNLQSTAAATAGVEDKWRKQQIMELEVFSKRMELVQEQIKLMLQGLRSAG